MKAGNLVDAAGEVEVELDERGGHREAAQARYVALATRLAVDDLEPEPATTALRAEIMSPSYRIG